jgi:hypothetical protein
MQNRINQMRCISYRKTRHIGVAIALVILSLIGTLHSEPVNLRVPDFFNAIHDQYGYNFVNASMAGRGNTGVSFVDGIGSALYNPAAFRTENDHFTVEFLVKFPTNEFNKQYFDVHGEPICRPLYENRASDTGGGGAGGTSAYKHYRIGNSYESPIPFSYLGIGLSPIFGDWNLGLSYSLNRSLSYNSYRRTLGGPREIVTMPSFTERQYTITANKPFGDMTLGLNSIFLHQVYSKYRAEGTEMEYDFDKLIFRLQIGFLYEWERLQFGFSYTPTNKEQIGTGEIILDAVYHSALSAGISCNVTDNLRLLFDIDLNRYSETSPFLDDQIVYKVGVEKMFETACMRAGMIYRPGVFDGRYSIENFLRDGSSYHVDSDIYNPANIPHSGIYDNNDMLMLTVGTSIKIYDSTILNLAFMHDVLGNVGRSQILFNVQIDFSVFERR